MLNQEKDAVLQTEKETFVKKMPKKDILFANIIKKY
jgi:hypothetical protein